MLKSSPQQNIEVVKFLNKYTDKVNHVRFTDGKYTNSPTDLLFSTIREFKSNQVNVLIQGDSWGEQLQNDAELEALKAIADKNEYGIINAGIGTYAPSLMRSQLQILRDDFNIQPSHIVAIIDNSDMGDELCRYKNQHYVDQSGNKYVHAFTIDEQHEVYALGHFMKSQNIYYSDSFNLTKFFRMTVNSLDYRIRDRFPRFFPGKGMKCGWSKISNYMINGVSPKERIYLKSIINEYIKEVFDGNAESLYMVTHPHRGHVSGGNKFSIKEIVEETIFESEFRDKIYLIDSKVLSGDLTIFKAESCGCHVTAEYVVNVYLPKIFNKIKEVSLSN